MQYMLLIHTDEKSFEKLSEAEMGAVFAAYGKFTQDAKDAGVWRAGEALHPTSMAQVVRVASGKTLTTDGPYAETKEQLGGYYLLDCPDIDEAIRWAAKIPCAQRGGAIEVRPVVQFG